MSIICITGKTGSGKSMFASILAEKIGYKHIDTDKICHEALKQKDIIQKIVNEFGEDILDEKLQIDKNKLGNVVFRDNCKLEFLTNLSWAYLEKYIDKNMKNSIGVVIDGVLVQKIKYFGLAKANILITASEKMRKEYVLKRDNISDEYYEIRNRNSVEYNEECFNYVYENKFQNMEKDIDEIISCLRLKPQIGFYAGSFDPFTYGHLQVAKESLELFDKVVIGIGEASHKKRTFDSDKMKIAIEKTFEHLKIKNVSVVNYTGLTTSIAEKERATFLIRGLRNGTDYAYEENIAAINQEISSIPTMYLRAKEYGVVSSSMVKELLINGKDVSIYVPKEILQVIAKNSEN